MADIAFTDSETRSLADVTKCGAYPYAQHPSTDALCWGYCLDDGAGKIWSPPEYWGNSDTSSYDPDEPTDLLDHIENGGYFVAWNAFFDRHIWNAVMVREFGWPYLRLEQVLCAQAQAEANLLPGKLEKACEALGTPFKKDPAGKRLIALLSDANNEWNSEEFETAENMGHMRSYCVSDCLAMRDVWQYTRPLTRGEWREYHASERINDRGVGVDVEFAQAAKEYAEAEFDDLNGQLLELTGDSKLTITNHVRKSRWLHDQLWPDEELQALTKRPEKKPGVLRTAADRATREAVLELVNHPEHTNLFADDHRENIIRFLEILEAGNSAAVRKFTAMVNQQIDGRVHGQYSFNGAGQTGRFSSRGIQIHNLIRDPVRKGNSDIALDAMDSVIAGQSPDDLFDNYGYPVSRLLARLIRPSFVASPGKTFVWADWDQIEARVLPWLSDSPGGEDKLDIFRSGRDVYKYAAAPIFGISDPESIGDDWKERLIGKILELALQFGGAVGALSSMARNYGVTLLPDEAQKLVDGWRVNNAWCVAYWHELWEAAMSAYRHPGEWYRAGRVRYLFHPNLMRGTLICQLPCGRWLVYPQFKHEYVEYVAEKDSKRHKKGELVKEWRTSFVKGFGSGAARVDLWYGVLAENATQGTAASFLRRALVELDDIVVLHTHDELVGECDEDEADAVAEDIEAEMTYIPEWAEGLPLSVSVERGPYYTK